MRIYLYEYSDGEFTVKSIEVKETAKLYKIPYGRSYMQVKKSNIGVVSGSYYGDYVNLYLTERDDNKASELFLKFYNRCIIEAIEDKESVEKKILEFKERQDRLLRTEIKEKEENNE